ncbi:hypothetical protein Srot_2904 [Segniliparus rotundus DSM 44985]|uniref:Uncharacterized protein n=1 Tax=Segniliparus rotundus (strain ATCC BAA-972 / CDC 1076 / CIP 108378 / DSM 44985 / JCM 13578) TaxID=640132 RepID=D6ZDS7_SEGRD|nr:hypothetical protein [Segniliparus rotundus]ADG99334.1 hypothetical protein Srot_2904 [Segniliparus rotundus DSM 44985]
MAVHRGQWRGYQDVGPAVKRFEYMDRMDVEEADQFAAARQRAEAYQQSLPPIEPDRVVEMDGRQVKVYENEKAREMARRDLEAKAIRGGRR